MKHSFVLATALVAISLQGAGGRGLGGKKGKNALGGKILEKEGKTAQESLAQLDDGRDSETARNVVELRSADFEEGTHRITEPGRYVLMEDIEFGPQEDNDYWPPMSLSGASTRVPAVGVLPWFFRCSYSRSRRRGDRSRRLYHPTE